MGAVGSMYIFVKVECSVKIKTTFPSHCVCVGSCQCFHDKESIRLCLSHHMVLVPEAGTRTFISKVFGPIRTADKGDAVFSSRSKYMDANKLGGVALDGSNDRNLSAKVISSPAELPEE